MLIQSGFRYVVLALAIQGCDSGTQAPQTDLTTPTKQNFPIHLEDHKLIGINYKHDNGMIGNYWPHEIMGPGAAILDIDQDGDMDLYLRQGGGVNARNTSDRLFLNQWIESGQLTFVDATSAYQIGYHGYGMGAVVGDYDGDGDEDLYLTNYGPDVLLRNDGDRLVEVDGVWQEDAWSTAATFSDLNQDGWLDLFVVHYNGYRLGQDIVCYNKRSQIDYCSPKSYPQLSDRLYLNREGQLSDDSKSSGVAEVKGYGLGVVAEDFNHDGLPDVLVANDATKNVLWINQGDATFVNQGVERGIAVNAKGEMEASMGIGISDVDGDLDFDVLMTHLDTESNTFYFNDSQGYFQDRTQISRMVQLSKPYTAFGVVWLDVNGDQTDDLLIANGAVNTVHAQRDGGEANPLRQQQQILIYEGSRFHAVTDSGLTFLNQPMVGRALVLVDWDNDGDKDVLLTTNNGPVHGLMNQSPQASWLGLDLRTSQGAQALGALVDVEFQSGQIRRHRYHNDGSYLASQDPRVIVKWTSKDVPQKVKIKWPNGQTTVLSEWPNNRYQMVTQS